MKRYLAFWLKLSVISLGLIQFSCLGDFKDLDKVKGFKWEPTVAVPLIDSNFDFYDFVEQSSAGTYVTSDPNGVITFIYDNGLLTKTGQSIYTIQDQSYSKSEDIPLTTTVTLPLVDSIVYSKKVVFDFATDPGKELDSVLLKAGQLDFQTSWNFTQPGKVLITFNSMTQSGDTVRLFHQFSGFTPNYVSTLDLSNAHIDLTDGGTTFNKFSLTFYWVIYNDGNTLPSPTSFNISLKLLTLQWRGIFGELGTETFSTATSTTQFDFFNVLSAGTFELDNPKALITIDNSFGVSADINMDNIWIENSQGTQKIQGTITNSPVTIDGITYAELGTKATTSIEINSTNSNIGDLIKDIPKSITYGFTGSAYGSAGKEFVMDTSRMDVNLKIELPFTGKIVGLTADQEYTFDGTNLDNLKNATLQMKSTNEFPFEVVLQVYFLDDFGNILETLFGNNEVILAASQNASDGTVVTPGQKTISVELSESQLTNISKATKLEMIAVINSTQGGTVPVTVLDTQKVYFTVGIQTTLNPTNN